METESKREVHALEIAIVALILRLAELWPDKKLWEDFFGPGFEWHVTTRYGTPGCNVGDIISVVVLSRGWWKASWYYEIACVLNKTKAGWVPDNGHLACVLPSDSHHAKHNFRCDDRGSSRDGAAPPFPHMKEVNL